MARSKKSKPKRILVFGEDDNDTKFIHEMLLGLCPEFNGMVKTFRKPPILIKDCDPTKVPGRVEIIKKLIDAEATSCEVVCVFAHEDCDDFEPAHTKLSRKIEEGFAEAGYHVHAVTPAWETEAWLFLWPEAVSDYRSGWRSLERFRGRDVGKIRNAKEELVRSLRPQGKGSARSRDYRESDAPMIAGKVREMGLANSPAGRSASYDAFRDRVRACCDRIGA